MAIIKCPQCNNSISDKHKVCPHCELDMTEMSEDKLASLSKIRSLKHNQSLQTHLIIAMILIFAGVYSVNTIEDQSTPQYTVAWASIAVGFVWGIVSRIRIILAKRRK